MKRTVLPHTQDTDYDYGDTRHVRWRETCLRRDGYLCVNCGRTAEHVHHKIHVDVDPSLRYDVDNGVSLCQRCHIMVHGANLQKAKERDQRKRTVYAHSDGMYNYAKNSHHKRLSP